MKFLKSNWQALATGLLAAIFFIAGQYLIPLIDDTAGTNDVGILHTLCFGLAGAFVALAFAAGALTVFFPTIDGWIDKGRVVGAWELLTPEQKIRYCVLTLFALVATFAFFTQIAAG